MRSLRKTFITLCTTALMFISTIALSSCGSKATIDGIEVTTPPTKTDYVIGETFDPTGMVVSVMYSDGKSEALNSSDYTYSPSGKLSTTTTRITITYKTEEESFTARQSIKVHNNIVSAVKKSDPNKLDYFPGELFDPTGMIITLTYENGDEKDVSITVDNADFKKEGLTEEDAVFTVKYLTHTFTLNLNIAHGLFIEAEDGIIKASNPSYPEDAVDVDEKHLATGGKYVGNLFAGDSITFIFDSDSNGVVDIAFRLASLYFKEADPENEWVPVWMGDVQFNRLCDFTVNGVKYNIPDDAILPGGGKSGGEPDPTLWFNWEEVAFPNINVVEGRNDIKLTFKEHDYRDTAHGDWAGKFAANVDSLKIMAHDCTITSHKFSLDYEVTNVALLADNNNPVLVLSGTFTQVGYNEEDYEGLFIGLPLVLQGDPYEVENAEWEDWDSRWFGAYSATCGKLDDGTLTFEVRYIINHSLYEYAFIAHFGGAGGEFDLKPYMEYFDDYSIEVTNEKGEIWQYTLAYSAGRFFNCVGISIKIK
ncbi:MAG: bacterial Ig-like domain-containing protein [Erysipelotrichales bacterium]|nr:bacterial Ig-like domain-containing protein [Erysipelotrichales bacterium]